MAFGAHEYVWRPYLLIVSTLSVMMTLGRVMMIFTKVMMIFSSILAFLN